MVFEKEQHLRDDGWTRYSHSRQEADSLMRQRYDQMLFDCPIGHLYGLCLLGTSLRVYCGDNDTGKITFATICPLLTLRRAFPSDSGFAYSANVGFKDDTANL